MTIEPIHQLETFHPNADLRAFDQGAERVARTINRRTDIAVPPNAPRPIRNAENIMDLGILEENIEKVAYCCIDAFVYCLLKNINLYPTDR